jgi:hypothetical protein
MKCSFAAMHPFKIPYMIPARVYHIMHPKRNAKRYTPGNAGMCKNVFSFSFTHPIFLSSFSNIVAFIHPATTCNLVAFKESEGTENTNATKLQMQQNYT